jgi:hypothetical protein
LRRLGVDRSPQLSPKPSMVAETYRKGIIAPRFHLWLADDELRLHDCDPLPHRCRLARQQTIRYSDEGPRIPTLR